MTVKDIDECSALYSQVFSSEPWNEPWTKPISLKRLTHIFESNGSLGVLAEDNGIKGFILGNSEPFHFGEMFYLREMCVDNNSQGQGIGTKIISELYKELESIETKGLYLVTEHDIPAVQFYEKNGITESNGMRFYSKMFETKAEK